MIVLILTLDNETIYGLCQTIYNVKDTLIRSMNLFDCKRSVRSILPILGVEKNYTNTNYEASFLVLYKV